MVLEPKVIESNFDSVNSPLFKLNISRVRPHLLKGSLSLHVRGECLSNDEVIKFISSYKLNIL
jgi:hypothetical protein